MNLYSKYDFDNLHQSWIIIFILSIILARYTAHTSIHYAVALKISITLKQIEDRQNFICNFWNF